MSVTWAVSEAFSWLKHLLNQWNGEIYDQLVEVVMEAVLSFCKAVAEQGIYSIKNVSFGIVLSDVVKAIAVSDFSEVISE